MPALRLLPDMGTLKHWVQDEGLTHQQIADRVYATTGNKVSRSTVSAALHRAGLTRPADRYSDELPWKVKTEHIREYPARMLRLLGRRNACHELSPEEDARLDRWLEKLDTEGQVIGYDPESKYGFYYVKRRRGDAKDGIPIRRRIVKIVE